MLTLKEFKKHLPPNHNLTEEEILKLRENMDSMANIFFDMWLKDKKKKALQIDYNPIKSEESEEKVNKAFDVLFDEVNRADH